MPRLWHGHRNDEGRTRMLIPFNSSPAHTLGVEWEMALVDPEGGDLVSVADQVFSHLDAGPRHRVHKELLLNTVELVTGICDTVPQAMADLAESMAVVRQATDTIGVDLFSAGMHPFASWQDQQITKAERYSTLIDRTQFWGRQMMIYGIHVHVGMPERDRVLPVINSLLRYFPHLQALSASSPFYDGVDTRYASNRTLLFQQLPTAGLPFQFDDWAQYEEYVNDLTVTGVIDELNEIRWDIRPSPTLGTIEVRVCDAMSTFEEVEAAVALVHCLIVDLDRRLAAGEALPTLPPWHVQENKWRSARYGLDTILIVDDRNQEAQVIESIGELTERLGPLSEDLGCADELRQVAGVIERGGGYERQRARARATRGDLTSVVQQVVGELRTSFERRH